MRHYIGRILFISLLIMGVSAHAAPIYELYLNTDNQNNTGCTHVFTDQNGSVTDSGFEWRITWTLDVNNNPSPLEKTSCQVSGGSVFNPPTPVAGGAWMQSTDPVNVQLLSMEVNLPLAEIGSPTPPVRMVYSVIDGTGSDVLGALNNGVGNPIYVPFAPYAAGTPIPSLTLYAVLGLLGVLVWFGFRYRRHIPPVMGVGLIIVAISLSGMTMAQIAGIVIDGLFADWSHVALLAEDEEDDATDDTTPDLQKLYAVLQNNQLYFRLDAKLPDTAAANQPPVFVKQAPSQLRIGDVFQYSPVVNDADHDTISLRMTQAPATATFTDRFIRWTPTVAGQYTFAIAASDGHHPDVVYTFTVTVTQSNRLSELPSLSVTQPPQIILGQDFDFNLGLQDAHHGVVQYQILSAPDNLTISDTGQVHWTPTVAGVSILKLNLIGSDNKELEVHLHLLTQVVVIPPTPEQRASAEGDEDLIRAMTIADIEPIAHLKQPEDLDRIIDGKLHVVGMDVPDLIAPARPEANSRVARAGDPITPESPETEKTYSEPTIGDYFYAQTYMPGLTETWQTTYNLSSVAYQKSAGSLGPVYGANGEIVTNKQYRIPAARITEPMRVSQADLHVPGANGMDISLSRMHVPYEEWGKHTEQSGAYGPDWQMLGVPQLKVTKLFAFDDWTCGDFLTNCSALVSVMEDETGESRTFYKSDVYTDPAFERTLLSKDGWKMSQRRLAGQPQYRVDAYASNGRVYGFFVYQWDKGVRTTQIDMRDTYGNTLKYIDMKYQNETNGHGGSALSPLSKIQGNDGRTVLIYRNGRLKIHGTWHWTVSELAYIGRRTFFQYDALALTTVTQPDNKQWRYAYQTVRIRPKTGLFGLCDTTDILTADPCEARVLQSITTPYGATISYQYTRCANSSPAFGINPSCLTRKTVSVNGQTHAWDYSTPITDFGLAYGKVVKLPNGFYSVIEISRTQPVGTRTVEYELPISYAIYNQYKQLLKKETLQWQLRRILVSPNPDGVPYPIRPPAIDNWSRTYVQDNQLYRAELLKKTVVYEGVSSSVSMSNYDIAGYPDTVTETGPRGTRVSRFSWFHAGDPWILGQMFTAESSFNGVQRERSSYHYHPMTRALLQVKKYGTDAAESLALTTHYGYSGQGDIEYVSDPMQNTTFYINYKMGTPQAVYLPEMGPVSQVVNQYGQVDSSTDAQGYTTQYRYDLMGRPISIQPPIHAATTISYTGNTVMTSRGGFRQTDVLDGLARTVASTTEDIYLGNSAVTMGVSYDAFGRTIFTSNPTAGRVANSTGTWTNYDGLGRVASIIQGYGTSIPATQYMTYSGQNEYLRDERGYVTKNEFSWFGEPGDRVLNRTLSFSNPVSVGAIPSDQMPLLQTTYYDYVPGTAYLQSATQGDSSVQQTRRYAYDSKWRMNRLEEPERGVVSYTHDKNGNVKSYAVAGGATAQFQYDQLGRLKQAIYTGKGFSDSSENETVSYDYDRNNNIIAAAVRRDPSTANNRWDYRYDANNNLLSETLTNRSSTYASPITGTIDYTYNTLDHLATRSTVSYAKQIMDYNPDSLGRPSKVGIYASQIQYYPDGQIQSYRLGNGITITQQQDARRRPTQIAAQGRADLLSVNYAYDAASNLLYASHPGNSYNTMSNLQYDGLNRFISGNSSVGQFQYRYNGLNNITQVTFGVEGSYNYGYNSKNQLFSMDKVNNARFFTMRYDNNGNVTSDADQGSQGRGVFNRFSYSGRNNMVESRTTGARNVTMRYEYDANNRRVVRHKIGSSMNTGADVGKDVGSFYQLYSVTGDFLGEFSSDLMTGREFVYLGGKVIAHLDSAPNAPKWFPRQLGLRSAAVGLEPLQWQAPTSYTHVELYHALKPDFSDESKVYEGVDHYFIPTTAGGYYRLKACTGDVCSDAVAEEQ